ncbi:MAG TPA: hypothetical protein VN328_12905 [Thermodesulfovibrionales bacterium]|nr:hypothetical protein [Thermodesulfovibrionales bacterium]
MDNNRSQRIRMPGSFCSSALLCLSLVFPAFAFTDSEISSLQKEIGEKPIGERIAFWAERFVGAPYDPDVLGEYVTKRVIVADERVDCMYHAFRSLELALGRTPEDAVSMALDKRFIGRGILQNGYVRNYEDRFQYGEDMLDSSKWGREITEDLGPVSYIRGSRGRERTAMISQKSLIGILKAKKRSPLRSGDIIFFVKAPDKRVSDEIVGHIGIIKMEGNTPYLVHASGKKNGEGKVKKVLFSDYVKAMSFAGARVSRFQ